MATNVCWAISALSERAYESAQSLGDDDATDPETYLLSKYFEALVERLLETTGRADGNQVRELVMSWRVGSGVLGMLSVVGGLAGWCFFFFLKRNRLVNFSDMF